VVMLINPILKMDYPDPDVIRVDETYYMLSTTMHFMPGGAILRSFDLVNWEIVTYVFERLEDNEKHNLEGDQNIYGQGMWAGCLRFVEGKFYVSFSANDTKHTYIYISSDFMASWQKIVLDEFYHDSSLLFDDDNRIYIVSGNTDIYLDELEPQTFKPKVDGIHKIIISEQSQVILGYEGAHIYKIHGQYYVFLIHWLANGNQRRVQACYRATHLDGLFLGKDILDEDIGYYNQGVAQGGIVDTPQGDWYSILFQDRGAIGRIPVLVPLTWIDGFPVMGKAQDLRLLPNSNARQHAYEPLFCSDDFRYCLDENKKYLLKKQWQWNHNPDSKYWSINAELGELAITTSKLSRNLTQAKNCLTQRMLFPYTDVTVKIKGSELNEGDIAGICALQGTYSFIALSKTSEGFEIIQASKAEPSNNQMGNAIDNEYAKVYEKVCEKVYEKISTEIDTIAFRICGNFENMNDDVSYFYRIDECPTSITSSNEWQKLGISNKHYFTLDHFVGCRVGLFIYSTQCVGGTVRFSDFNYGVKP
jgi:beta-xylosidase